jgi:hypothetical protein
MREAREVQGQGGDLRLFQRKPATESPRATQQFPYLAAHPEHSDRDSRIHKHEKDQREEGRNTTLSTQKPCSIASCQSGELVQW